MEAAPSYSRILSDFLDPMTPDAVTLGVLLAVSDENVRAQSLAQLIRSDAEIQQYLFAQTFLSERLTEWLVEYAERPDRDLVLLERILGLLGKSPVRNLVACTRVGRLLGELDPDVAPAKLIPFALAAESYCNEKGWIAPGAAFAAGFHYDCLAALMKRTAGPDAAEEKGLVEGAFKEGIKIAKSAYAIGHHIEEMKQGGQLFAAGLLAPIGKALMGRFYSKSRQDRSWAAFQKSCDAGGERAGELASFLEGRRFALTHSELSSLLVSFGATLRHLEKPIYFYNSPERLRRAEPESYALGSLLSVAARLATAAGSRAKLESYHLKWLLKQGLDPSNLPLSS